MSRPVSALLYCPKCGETERRDLSGEIEQCYRCGDDLQTARREYRNPTRVIDWDNPKAGTNSAPKWPKRFLPVA